ncbi:hypothetical protein BDZ45DRAFT_765423 [Acephala macrosclerotiorum]|nr:hypothetical protein BDZ45DRAFT_765423 [Acephala macrosclerotiorum]
MADTSVTQKPLPPLPKCRSMSFIARLENEVMEQKSDKAMAIKAYEIKLSDAQLEIDTLKKTITELRAEVETEKQKVEDTKSWGVRMYNERTAEANQDRAELVEWNKQAWHLGVSWGRATGHLDEEERFYHDYEHPSFTTAYYSRNKLPPADINREVRDEYTFEIHTRRKIVTKRRAKGTIPPLHTVACKKLRFERRSRLIPPPWVWPEDVVKKAALVGLGIMFERGGLSVTEVSIILETEGISVIDFAVPNPKTVIEEDYDGFESEDEENGADTCVIPKIVVEDFDAVAASQGDGKKGADAGAVPKMVVEDFDAGIASEDGEGKDADTDDLPEAVLDDSDEDVFEDSREGFDDSDDDVFEDADDGVVPEDEGKNGDDAAGFMGRVTEFDRSTWVFARFKEADLTRDTADYEVTAVFEYEGGETKEMIVGPKWNDQSGVIIGRIAENGVNEGIDPLGGRNEKRPFPDGME